MGHLQESHFEYNDINRLKVKGQKRIYHANINQRKEQMAILVSDRVDIRAKKLPETEGEII